MNRQHLIILLVIGLVITIAFCTRRSSYSLKVNVISSPSEELMPPVATNIDDMPPLNYTKRLFCKRGRLNPSVFVIGVQKCGTTTLQGILEKFTTIHSGRTKEHHMFDHPGRRSDTTYNGEFPLCTSYRRTFDNTPNYTNPDTTSAKLIKEHAIRNGHPLDQYLFIAMVRPNYKRLRSAFKHELVTNRKFPPAWKDYNYSYWVRNHLKKDNRNTDRMQMKSRGYYGEIFSQYLDSFPTSTFLFIESTKAFTSQQPIADTLSKLLGLPRVDIDKIVWEYKQTLAKPEPVIKEDEDMVKEYYRPHEIALKELLESNRNHVYTIPENNFFDSWGL